MFKLFQESEPPNQDDIHDQGSQSLVTDQPYIEQLDIVEVSTDIIPVKI